MIPIQLFLKRLAAKEHLLFLALGDSNTNNTHFTDGGKQWPELLHADLKEEYGTQKLLLLNAGVSGDTVRDALARFETDVARFRPDFVILCLGSNDANKLSDEEFAAGYNLLVDKLLALGCALLLKTPTPVWERSNGLNRIWPGDAKLQTRVEQTRQIAKERGLPLLDTYALWQADEAAGTLNLADLMKDEVHTNAKGHRKVFEEVREAIQEMNKIKN